MDWYFGGSIDDLVVPKNQDLSDRLPSPDSWSQWGVNLSGNFGSRNKCYVIDANLFQEEVSFNGKNLCDGVEMETSVHDKDWSNSSSVSGGFSEESRQRTAVSHDRPDYNLDDLAGIQQMDDIFLSSLLEDLPETENFQKSFDFSSESECGVMPADNLLSDTILDSQSISSGTHSMGSSKYLKTHAFSPSAGWEKGEVTPPKLIPSNLEQKDYPPVKAPLVKVSIPSEQNSTHGVMDEETSLEESVLQELEMVMQQLTDKTRICFRDALYRLANNSNQQVVTQSQNEDHAKEAPSSWTVQDEKIRSGRRKEMESETNTIDRAIANLMFTKMDINVHEFPVGASVNPKKEVIGATEPLNCSSHQPQIHHFPCQLVSPRDAEVPVFDQKVPHNRQLIRI